MRTVLSLLAAILFLAACDTASVDPEENDLPALIPFEVGTTWVLDRVGTNAHGDVTSTTTDTLRVVDHFSYQEEEWIKLAGSSSALSIVRGFYVLREDGYHRSLTDPRDSSAEPYLFLRYPAEVGDSYELPGAEPAPIAWGPIAVHIGSLADPVSTGMGTIPTIRYTFEPGIIYYQYEPYEVVNATYNVRMAPEHGFVQFESVYVGQWESQFEGRHRFKWTVASISVEEVPGSQQQAPGVLSGAILE